MAQLKRETVQAWYVSSLDIRRLQWNLLCSATWHGSAAKRLGDYDLLQWSCRLLSARLEACSVYGQIKRRCGNTIDMLCFYTASVAILRTADAIIWRHSTQALCHMTTYFTSQGNSSDLTHLPRSNPPPEVGITQVKFTMVSGSVNIPTQLDRGITSVRIAV